MRLSRVLKGKRPEYNKKNDNVIMHDNNTRPHVATVVKVHLEGSVLAALSRRCSLYHLFLSVAFVPTRNSCAAQNVIVKNIVYGINKNRELSKTRQLPDINNQTSNIIPSRFVSIE